MSQGRADRGGMERTNDGSLSPAPMNRFGWGLLLSTAIPYPMFTNSHSSFTKHFIGTKSGLDHMPGQDQEVQRHQT